MANSTKLKEDLCRTCLKTVTKTYNIFEHYKNNKLISKVLAELVNLEIQENDGFPTNVCDYCIAKIHIVYDFKMMALESHTKLQSIHGSNDLIGKIEDDSTNVEFATEVSIVENEKENKSIDVIEENLNESESKLNKTNTKDDREVTVTTTKNDEDLFSVILNFNENNEIEELDISEDDLEYFVQFFDISVYKMFKTTLTQEEKAKARLNCKLCDIDVSFVHYFSEHLPLHFGQYPFQCPICMKGYRIPWELKKHVKRVHRAKGPYKCELVILKP